MIIIDSNSDYNVHFGRALVLISELSFLKEERKPLTIERIVVYDFFLRYPLLLTKTLKFLNKKIPIDIKSIEIDTISTLYPSYQDLYKMDNIKTIIQALYSKELINIEKELDGTFIIYISEDGKNLSLSLESDYFVRLREISKAVSLLHSVAFSTLRTTIKNLLYG
jgi:hypothetical protein